jgi:hypothetical protein
MKSLADAIDAAMEAAWGPQEPLKLAPPRRWTDEDWLLIPRIKLDPPKKPEVHFADEILTEGEK